MPYDTESQSRNVSCVPFRGRGPRSGEGVDGGNPDYDTRCGRDRRKAVRTAMEHPIGALPRTPFPASRDFPSRGNEKYGEEKQRVIYFMYHSAVSPFGGERSEPIRRMLNMLYNIESQSRNADFISIARRAIHNPRAKGPSNLRTLRPTAGQS